MLARWAGLALSAVVAAGCGDADSKPAAAPPPSTSPAAPTSTVAPNGPDAFVADVRAVGMQGKDMAATTDQQILAIGRQTCRVFDTQEPPSPVARRGGYQALVQVLEAQVGITEGQAETLLSSAVRNLCPENSDVLPT